MGNLVCQLLAPFLTQRQNFHSSFWTKTVRKKNHLCKNLIVHRQLKREMRDGTTLAASSSQRQSVWAANVAFTQRGCSYLTFKRDGGDFLRRSKKGKRLHTSALAQPPISASSLFIACWEHRNVRLKARHRDNRDMWGPSCKCEMVWGLGAGGLNVVVSGGWWRVSWSRGSVRQRRRDSSLSGFCWKTGVKASDWGGPSQTRSRVQRSGVLRPAPRHSRGLRRLNAPGSG